MTCHMGGIGKRPRIPLSHSSSGVLRRFVPEAALVEASRVPGTVELAERVYLQVEAKELYCAQPKLVWMAQDRRQLSLGTNALVAALNLFLSAREQLSGLLRVPMGMSAPEQETWMRSYHVDHAAYLLGQEAIAAVLRRRPLYSEQALLGFHRRGLSPTELLPHIERVVDSGASVPELAHVLGMWQEMASGCDFLGRVTRILGKLESDDAYTVEAVDAWSSALRVTLSDADTCRLLTPILRHAESVTGAQPSARWLREAERLLTPLPPDRFVASVSPLIDAVGTAADEPVDNFAAYYVEKANTHRMVSPVYSDLLRGLLWVSLVVDARPLIPSLAAAAERCYAKIPRFGFLSPKLGNACVDVLASTASLEAHTHLLRFETVLEGKAHRELAKLRRSQMKLRCSSCGAWPSAECRDAKTLVGLGCEACGGMFDLPRATPHTPRV